MSMSTREQLIAFLALIAAILLLGLAPIAVSGLMGKVIPDSLIAVSDKTVTGLVGVLGTIAAMVFRTNRVDEVRADNTGKALDLAHSNKPVAPTPVVVANAANNPVPVEGN
jgi:multidrug efflux pump subunit AcrA (membrane-fusion protein)